MKFIYLVTFLLTLFSFQIKASIRPSFDLGYASWNATDIVYATEGDEIDGKFTILESLKGELKTSQQISVPEMAQFKPESARQIYEWYSNKKVEPSQFVTNSKMILFLKKSDNLKWLPADYFNNFPTSVIWFENDKTYAFIQTINPGPSSLVKYNFKESEILKSIATVLKKENELKEVLEIQDISKRAEALEKFTKMDFRVAQQRAFDELVKIGVVALPVLQGIIRDEQDYDIQYLAFESLGNIGGNKVEEYLAQIVDEELKFWKAKLPQLKFSWRKKAYKDSEYLFYHQNRVSSAIYQLERLKDKKAKSKITKFCNFWNSQPKLVNTQENEMKERCESYFQAIRQ